MQLHGTQPAARFICCCVALISDPPSQMRPSRLRPLFAEGASIAESSNLRLLPWLLTFQLSAKTVFRPGPHCVFAARRISRRPRPSLRHASPPLLRKLALPSHPPVARRLCECKRARKESRSDASAFGSTLWLCRCRHPTGAGTRRHQRRRHVLSHSPSRSVLGRLHLPPRSSFPASRLNQHVFFLLFLRLVSLLFRWLVLCWIAVLTLMRLKCCAVGRHCMLRLDGAGEAN
jgi:hypothetical protein